MSQWTRGRCALAAAELALHRGEEVATELAIAGRAVRALDKESWEWSFPLAALLRASCAALRTRDPAEVRRDLETAPTGFDAVGMGLHAAAARRRLGELLGGDEGRRLVEHADAWMTAQTIRSPARMTRMIAPGFAGL